MRSMTKPGRQEKQYKATSISTITSSTCSTAAPSTDTFSKSSAP